MLLKNENGTIRLPDFLIVGGARCGTSSLYSYLNEHPEVFMPDLKEPHFFNYLGCSTSPHPGRLPWTIEDYAELFKPGRQEQKLGEASASYLHFHEKVIPTMRSIYGGKAREVKIVIILRNPIERAWSYYMLLRRNKHNLNFFETVHKYCRCEEKTFHDFLNAGHYAEQVREYLGAFESVRILMFEDFQRDPAAVVRGIFNLIEVNDTRFIPANINTIYNASGTPKSGLGEFFYYFLFQENIAKKFFKCLLPLRLRLRIKAEIGTRVMNNVEMPADVREFLTKTYRQSLESLRDLLPLPAQKATVDKWRI
jgi:hypothetical protein